MATLPKVLIDCADYQIGGGVALRLRTQPPLGTVYNFLLCGDEQTSIASALVRTEVGAQIYKQAQFTVLKFTQRGEKLDDG